MTIHWTKKRPEKCGKYLILNNGNISVMMITVNDLEIRIDYPDYLKVDYWSSETINEKFLKGE